MKAIILAAGEGTRLQPYTNACPKCLVELGNRSLLEHQISVLKQVGISDLSLVTGYRAQQLQLFGCPTFHNPKYASTNMVASMMCASALFDGAGDVLITYGDILYEPRIIESLCHVLAPIAITVDLDWLRLWQLRMEDPLSDAETLKMDGDRNILELGKKPKNYREIEAQYMGLLKFDSSITPAIVQTYEELKPAVENFSMTEFLQHLIASGVDVRGVPIRGGWLEVDSVQDYETYQELLRTGRLNTYCRLSF